MLEFLPSNINGGQLTLDLSDELWVLKYATRNSQG